MTGGQGKRAELGLKSSELQGAICNCDAVVHLGCLALNALEIPFYREGQNVALEGEV